MFQETCRDAKIMDRGHAENSVEIPIGKGKGFRDIEVQGGDSGSPTSFGKFLTQSGSGDTQVDGDDSDAIMSGQEDRRLPEATTDIEHDITLPDLEASGHPSGQEESTWRHLITATVDLVPGIGLQLRITIEAYAAQGRPELVRRYPLHLFHQRVDIQRRTWGRTRLTSGPTPLPSKGPVRDFYQEEAGLAALPCRLYQTPLPSFPDLPCSEGNPRSEQGKRSPGSEAR